MLRSRERSDTLEGMTRDRRAAKVETASEEGAEGRPQEVVTTAVGEVASSCP